MTSVERACQRYSRRLGAGRYVCPVVAKTIAVVNQKGGVGKTTTAVNVAACIAEAGYETLLVDIDPQANATVGLGLAKDLVPNVYDVLAGDARLPQRAL